MSDLGAGTIQNEMLSSEDHVKLFFNFVSMLVEGS
jgi:hypothetical protein